MLVFFKKKIFKILILLTFLIIVGCIFFSFKTGILEISKVIQFLKLYPILSPVMFILIYMILAVSFIPTLPLNLAAGFLWGTFSGTALTLIGAGLGSLVSFYISRYLFKEQIGNLFKGKIWDFVNKELSKKEWQVVAFTRINPIFPFGPTSYFFGITKIKVRNYILPTIICIMPGATAFSAIGSTVENFILNESDQDLYKNIIITSGLLTILICIRIGFKIYQKKINKSL